MRSSRLSLIGLGCISTLCLVAAEASWKTKPSAQWTEEEARQVLSASPWSRQITAGVARRLSEDELREAGQMGQPHGIGYDGVDPKGSGPKLPAHVITGNQPSARSLVRSMPLRLRWESAVPIQVAEFKTGEDPPIPDDRGYCIAVYGVPGGPFQGDPQRLGEPLKKEAVLRRPGKLDVRPSNVAVFQRPDGTAVIYVFSAAAEITLKDQSVEFEAHIGRIVVLQDFHLAEMVFAGKLEI